LVFPLFYNGPINYFARLVREKEIILEHFDHYIKQTYRNRCRIAGPNGVITLSVPVKRERGKKNLYRDIRIDYRDPWNKIHWKSIVASYASSPYFEFISDDLLPFYEQKYEFLADLNHQLLEKTLKILGCEIPTRFSIDFQDISGKNDPRYFIHPKMEEQAADPGFRPVTYHQVFSDKYGFRSNLSILDLVFNQGPGSLTILNKSLRI
jgi:hypothetical protein